MVQPTLFRSIFSAWQRDGMMSQTSAESNSPTESEGFQLGQHVLKYSKVIRTDHLPDWVAQVHRLITNGHGSQYGENHAILLPNMADRDLFPALRTAEKVILVYQPQEKR